MTHKYDVIVLGLGAMGSSTLYQLSELKKSTFPELLILGIDQHNPPHSKGSSHGETRITRETNFRDDKYVRLAKRSHNLFREIENQTQNKFGNLYKKTGGLLLDSSKSQEILSKIKAAAIKHDIPYSLFDYKKLCETYPQFKTLPYMQGIFEHNMGYLRPERCIDAQLYLAQQNGAEVHTNVKISSFKKTSGELIEVISQDGTRYLTEKLIVCAGPWVNDFMPKKGVKIYRQVLYWFEVEDSLADSFKPDNFPVYVWYLEEDNVVYGFPLIEEDNCVKIAAEEAISYLDPYLPITPETVNREVSMEEKQNMFNNFIKPYFKGITNNCVKAQVCLYSVAPDWEFIIDFLPGYDEKVILASPSDSSIPQL